MTTRSLHVGAVAPYAYEMDLVPADVDGIDLSLVTAGEIEAEGENGTVQTWTASRSNQTATTLRLTHTMVAGELADPGLLLVRAKLTTPTGLRYSRAKKLLVRHSFA